MFAKTLKKALTAAVLIGAFALTGCATSGSSSSNAPLETSVTSHAAATVSIREITKDSESRKTVAMPADVDAIRPEHVINRSKAHVTRSGEVYLMRGLANVFSRGIDDMADRLRASGVDASNFSYQYWEPIARDIAARAAKGQVSYPVIIMGHSLGGNESSKFANYLANRGVRVELVVTYDPVETGHVGANIGKVVNYYLPNANADNRIFAGKGFSGKIDNVDVSGIEGVRHVTVEKDRRFQKPAIDSVMSLTGTI